MYMLKVDILHPLTAVISVLIIVMIHALGSMTTGGAYVNTRITNHVAVKATVTIRSQIAIYHAFSRIGKLTSVSAVNQTVKMARHVYERSVSVDGVVNNEAEDNKGVKKNSNKSEGSNSELLNK